MQQIFAKIFNRQRTTDPASETRSQSPIGTQIENWQDLNVRFYTDYPTCNLSCSYCVAGHGKTHKKPEKNFWNVDNYNKIMDNIAQLKYRVNLRIGVGGEFFVSKDLVAGARRFSHSPNCGALNLITNLTLSPSQFEKTFDGFDRSRIAMVASFHPEQIKDHEAWFTTAEIMSKKYDFAVIMVGNPVDLDNILEYRRKLIERNVEVFIQPFFGPLNGKTYPQAYTEDDLSKIRKMIYSRHDYEYLINVKKPSACNAGYKAIYVNPMGDVYPCGMGHYKSKMGNLVESPELQMRSSAYPCPFSACQCDTENVNTIDFETHYQRSGRNQHRYKYKFHDIALEDDRYAEWNIRY